MRKITNRCYVISGTPVYHPSLFTTLAVREDFGTFFGFLSAIKHCTVSQYSGSPLLRNLYKKLLGSTFWKTC